MSTRLTITLRNRIKVAAKEKLYKPLKDSVEMRMGSAIRDYFTARYKRQKGLPDAMAACKKAGLLYSVEYCSLRFAGRRFYIEFTEPVHAEVEFVHFKDLQLNDEQLRKLPGLTELLKPLAAEYVRIEKEWGELEAEIAGMLASVQTVKRLVEAWPKVLEFYPRLADTAATETALVVNPADLDKRIGAFAAGK